MKKDVTHRIAYYTKKVTERMSIHPAKVLPAAYKYRSQRLLNYKNLLGDEIMSMGLSIWQK